MTIQELLSSSQEDKPPKRGLSSPVAEKLLAHVLKTDRTTIVAHPERTVSPASIKRFGQLIARAKKEEPLAYLIGAQFFCDLIFTVTKDTLIPRPETEWLVEQAAIVLQQHPEIKTVIDAGTGSGCIIISTYKRSSPTLQKKVRWIATDISKKTLAVAKNNAKKHATKITFVVSDLLTKIKLRERTLILANLPYLTTKDYINTPKGVRKFEPKQALIAGKDGLEFYKKLVHQIAAMKLNNFYALWEVDPCHAEELVKVAQKNFPKKMVSIKKDFNNLDRYLTIK